MTERLEYKITLYGDYGVGKTSLSTRLLRKEFYVDSPSTIGASFTNWKQDIKLDADSDLLTPIGFGLWDTAGQERFNSILPMYLRKADAIFYCCDYNEPFISKDATNKYQKALEYSPNCHFYLVMTKIDESEDSSIINTNAERWVQDHGVKGCYYTSSKTGQGVQELFNDMANNLLLEKPPVIDFQTKNFISLKPDRASSGWCCY